METKQAADATRPRQNVRTAHAVVSENTVSHNQSESQEGKNVEQGDYSRSITEEEIRRSAQYQTRKKDTQSDITKRYQSDVDGVLNMLNTKHDTLIIGYTPELMQKMGMPPLPFVIGTGHVYSAAKTELEAKHDGNYRKGVHYHGLGEDVIKNIYEKLQDPVMIIAAKDVKKNAYPLRSTHSVVAIVNVGQAGNFLLLPVEITANRNVNGKRMDVNVLSGAYMKNVTALVNEAIALEDIGDIGIYYAKKEATNLIGAGVQFPIRLQDMIASNPIVRSFDEKVNMKISEVTQSPQFKRWFGSYVLPGYNQWRKSNCKTICNRRGW